VSPGGDRHETGLRALEALAGPDGNTLSLTEFNG
jgi:hypothetical protein